MDRQSIAAHVLKDRLDSIFGGSTAILSAAFASISPGARAAEPCPAFDQVVIADLPKRWADADVAFADAWAGWATTVKPARALAAPSETAFRLGTSEMSRPEARAFEIRGRRSTGGWRIEARSQDMAGPIGPWTAWRAVWITGADAGRLDGLVLGPCLWRSPPFLPAELPVTGGRISTRFDGPTTFFDVQAGGRRWGGIQASWVLGPPGRLRSLLMAAAFNRPGHVDANVISGGLLTPEPR